MKFLTYCAEACESLIRNEGMDWIEATYNDIHAKIKFEPINQKWLVNVALNSHA